VEVDLFWEQSMTIETAAPPAVTVDVLSGAALAFIGELHTRFEPRRRELLAARASRRGRLLAGPERPGFLERTRSIRDGDWTISPVPAALIDRRVEITGPTERKMLINALNSGARVFMADFEDANAPTWSNMIEGQANLFEAVRGTISLQTPERTYALRRSGRDAVRAPARLASARTARFGRRCADLGRAIRLRDVRVAQRL
jgi:malate synthase